ncbi:hypothetical protein KC353_g50 [Hortaea werneckii]|nr:hypothetical protein KC353_g50 [Hortaea werneckii]
MDPRKTGTAEPCTPRRIWGTCPSAHSKRLTGVHVFIKLPLEGANHFREMRPHLEGRANIVECSNLMTCVARRSDLAVVDASPGAAESPGEGVHTGCDRVLRRRVPSLGDPMGDEGTYSEPGGVWFSCSSGICDRACSKSVAQTRIIFFASFLHALLRSDVAQHIRVKHNSRATAVRG